MIKKQKNKYSKEKIEYIFNNITNINIKKDIKIRIRHFIVVEKFIIDLTLLNKLNNHIVKHTNDIIDKIKNDINNNTLDDKQYFNQDLIIGIKNNRVYYNLLLLLFSNYQINLVPLYNGIFYKITFFIKRNISIVQLLNKLNYIFISKLFDNVIFDAYEEFSKKENILNFCNNKYTFYRPILKYYIIIKTKKIYIYNNLRISINNVIYNDFYKIYRYIVRNTFKYKLLKIIIQKKYFITILNHTIVSKNLTEILQNNDIKLNNFIIYETIKQNFKNIILLNNNKQYDILILLTNINEKKINQYQFNFIIKNFINTLIIKIKEIESYINKDKNIKINNIEELYKNIYIWNNKINCFFKHEIIFNIYKNYIKTPIFNRQIINLIDINLLCNIFKHLKINKNYISSFLFNNNINIQYDKENINLITHYNCDIICYHYENYINNIEKKNKLNLCFLNKNIILINIVNKLLQVIFLINENTNFNSSKDPFFIRKKIKKILYIYENYVIYKDSFFQISDIIKRIYIDTKNNIKGEILIIKNIINILLNKFNKKINDIQQINIFLNIKNNNDFYILLIKNLQYIIYFLNIKLNSLLKNIIKRINGLIKNTTYSYNNINYEEYIKNNTTNNIIKLLKKYDSIINIKQFEMFLNNIILLIKHLLDNYKIIKNKSIMQLIIFIKYKLFYLFILI